MKHQGSMHHHEQEAVQQAYDKGMQDAVEGFGRWLHAKSENKAFAEVDRAFVAEFFTAETEEKTNG